MEKVVFQGLKETDYIHDDEVDMRYGSTFNAIQTGLGKISNLSAALMRKTTLGKYIEIDSKTAPKIMNIVRNVCKILSYPFSPKVYICHEAAQTNFCAGTDNTVIIISDYIFEHFEENMLYFLFGNIVSMLKSGHQQMIAAYSIIPETIVTAPIELLIKRYLRAADMTSDRGGLLACQDIAAALKCILWEAGISLNEIRFLDTNETIELANAYISGVENFSRDSTMELAIQAKENTMNFKPHPYRIKELLIWYETGYRTLMQKGVQKDV